MSEKIVLGLIFLAVALMCLFAGFMVGVGVMAYRSEADLEYCKNYFDGCREDLEVCRNDLEVIEEKNRGVLQRE